MTGVILGLFGCILVAWTIAGRWEWCIPDWLRQRIVGVTDVEIPVSACRGLEQMRRIGNCGLEDLEKAIYILWKEKKKEKQGLMLGMEISWPAETATDEEKQKLKWRLEKRFPGLTLVFLELEPRDERCSFML